LENENDVVRHAGPVLKELSHRDLFGRAHEAVEVRKEGTHVVLQPEASLRDQLED
jgi:hypothetical protein